MVAAISQTNTGDAPPPPRIRLAPFPFPVCATGSPPKAFSFRLRDTVRNLIRAPAPIPRQREELLRDIAAELNYLSFSLTLDREPSFPRSPSPDSQTAPFSPTALISSVIGFFPLKNRFFPSRTAFPPHVTLQTMVTFSPLPLCHELWTSRIFGKHPRCFCENHFFSLFSAWTSMKAFMRERRLNLPLFFSQKQAYPIKDTL